MKPFLVPIALALIPTMASPEGMAVEGAYVPAAPPGVMAHAAYLSLENTGTMTRSLIGVFAEGYAATHLHQSLETDGVATMSVVRQLDIAPGQRVELKPGGLHIMMMRPNGTAAAGDVVPLTLSFANGASVSVEAVVKERKTGS